MNAETGRHESAYKEVARTLRTAILQREYAYGVRLPTEAQLSDRYGVSRQTVRRAFHDLVSEGLVYRVRGRGTFAASKEGRYLRQFGSVEDLMGLSVDTTLVLLSPLHREINVDAASRLRLDSDAVYELSFLRTHEGMTFCHTAVWLPPTIGRELEPVSELTEVGTTSTVTVIGLIDTRTKRPIAEADQSITATAASPGIARQLGCQEGKPVLRIDRMYYDTAGHPLELAVSHFLPEQYSYRVRLRRSLS